MLIRFFALIFLCGCLSAFAETAPKTPARSIVYTVRDPAAIKGFRTNPAVVHAMVDRLVLAVTGERDLRNAWLALVAPTDVVGIKISAAGGELFTTHHDVVNAIADGLHLVGIPRERIIVWDRSLSEIKQAGFRPASENYQMMPVPPRDGYDPKAAFTAPIVGRLVWGDLQYRSNRGTVPLLSDNENTSEESHFCRIVSTAVTKIINVPVMSDSSTNGIAGCLYNASIPNVDNWRRFAQPNSFAAAGIAQVYSEPLLRKKIVLNLMDGLIAQYAGGPQSEPNFALHFGTLLASKDSVAIDAIALRQIEQWRANAKFPPAAPYAAHVPYAAQMGLGTADPARIEVRNIGR